MEIVLLTGLYPIKTKERIEEIRHVFKCNCDNRAISEIIVFFEKYDDILEGKNDTKEENKEKEDEKEINTNTKIIGDYSFLEHPKVTIFSVDKRQTFQLFFDYANAHLQNTIVITANMDIIFDKTISRVYELTFGSKTTYMLTRWEKVDMKRTSDNSVLRELSIRKPFISVCDKLTIQENKTESWSFDSIIFRSPIDISKLNLDIELGIPGCDSYLLLKFLDKNFTLSNPCLDIRTYHHHANTERTETTEYGTRDDYYCSSGLSISTTDGKKPSDEFMLV
jgi:hypothetical protein